MGCDVRAAEHHLILFLVPFELVEVVLICDDTVSVSVRPDLLLRFI